MSCVLSYIYIALISLAARLFEQIIYKTCSVNFSFQFSPLVISGLTIILGTILALCFAKLYTSSKFKRIMVKTFHKTPNDDIWRDVLDLDRGSNLKVYLKNQDYYIIGHHKNHEEKGNDSWLALSGFCKIDKQTNQNYKSEPSYIYKDNIIITIRFSDIEHIEIFSG